MSAAPAVILIVEDDPEIRQLVSELMRREGFEVEAAEDAAAMDVILGRVRPDLVILDLMLPGEDGLSICRRLRAQHALPILMLTAKSDEIDRVVGLEMGADDYLVKPFEVEELVARINALLRRASGMVRLRFDDLEIDKENRRVIIDGEPVALTLRESQLLLHLVHRLDRVTTRSELLAQVWNTSFDPGSNVLEVHISRLREKLGKHAWRVATVRGAGYVFRSHEPP